MQYSLIFQTNGITSPTTISSIPDTVLMRRTARGDCKNARALFTKLAKIKLPKSGVAMETITIAMMSIGATLVKSKIQARPPYKIKSP